MIVEVDTLNVRQTDVSVELEPRPSLPSSQIRIPV